ncbi:hypothetical protein [Hoeflea sp. 108]|uniref:hypothetical protein n=1 Tax=Hoeflea sp. 108 TaxID=1116369 RepID=UPI0012F89596|nr:hypothetical protein [Hoeflea sp. 108]
MRSGFPSGSAQNKEIEGFRNSKKSGNALGSDGFSFAADASTRLNLFNLFRQTDIERKPSPFLLPRLVREAPLRLLSYALVVVGALLCAATFAGWIWLNAFACGMSPTGCNGFRLAWHDTEALAYFVPPLVIGVALAATGATLLFSDRRR